MRRLRGVLFDLDGTLALTDHVHHEMWAAMLHSLRYTERHPQATPSDRAWYQQHICGAHNEEIVRRLFPDEHWPELSHDDKMRLANEKEAKFLQHVDEKPVDPPAGLIELLQGLDAASVPFAVVTNAPRKNAEAMLRALGRASPHLAVLSRVDLVIGEECLEPKPSARPYQEGVRRIGLDRGESAVVAFEDSPSGARSAVAAGLTCVGVGDSVPAEHLLNAGCAVHEPDYASITVDWLERLLDRRGK